MLSFKKILCPVDFSKLCFMALEAANSLALQHSSELYVVNVVPPIPLLPADTEMAAEFGVSLYEAELRLLAEQSLQEVVEQRVSKELQVHPIVLHGDPPYAIVEVADREKVDLIVITTHGRRGWRQLAFGSVAQKVTQIAHCPVLLIPAPHEEGRAAAAASANP